MYLGLPIYVQRFSFVSGNERWDNNCRGVLIGGYLVDEFMGSVKVPRKWLKCVITDNVVAALILIKLHSLYWSLVDSVGVYLTVS